MERAKLILAIDQGTTNTKALLLDRSGAVRARASRPLSIAFPQPGWVEQDARALWVSVMDAAADCLAQAPDAELAAVGISNQRESAVVWDRRTGEPAGPCIVWQCRRTAPFCEELRARGVERFVRERTGLPLDPLFSASKIRWLLDRPSGDWCAGTVDSWLLWNLTGGKVHATDASNASRTQLLNLRSVEWDSDLLRLFGIPPECLPQVRASSGVFGVTAGCRSLPDGIPVAALIGDSHAALFGHAAFAPGAVKATYGTGSSLMTPVDSPIASRHGLATTVAWAEPGSRPQDPVLPSHLRDAAPSRDRKGADLADRALGRVRYALEGNITNTGGAVQWLAEFLSLPGGAEDVAALSASVPDSGGVYLVPAFAGLGAPHWDSAARGLLCGLTRGATAAHAARATLDSIAYQIRDVFEAMRRDSPIPAAALYADGGASRNDRLMQFQADILGCPVIRAASSDLSAIGAAWLAGLAVGYWTFDELAALPRPTARFEPAMPEDRRTELIRGWEDALGRAKTAAFAEALP